MQTVRTILRAPALHYLALGLGLYLVAGAFGGGVGEGASATVADAPVVEVPSSRLVQAREDFVARMHREPTPEEEAELRDAAVDRALLFRYALDLGLDEQPNARRRLAQIASFVGEDAASTEMTDSTDELARRALELGLHRDDVVLQRILVDSAERLIRGAVLAREPSEEALREHLEAHPERFRGEERLEITYRRASEMVELPLLLERDLARRLGRDFLAALDRERVGEWQGPLASWDGDVEVRIERHLPAGPAPLDEVRDQVRAEVRELLAERWLDRRLDQLRGEYDVVVGTRMAGGDDAAARPPTARPSDGGGAA